jgi:hypothetical protein
LRVSLGSTQGDYDYSISLFDEILVRGKTVKEIQELSFTGLPGYKLGKQSFYTITLDLGKDTNVPMELNPFLFSLSY